VGLVALKRKKQHKREVKKPCATWGESEEKEQQLFENILGFIFFFIHCLFYLL